MSGFFSPEVVEVQGEMDCGVHCLFFERIRLFIDHDTQLYKTSAECNPG
jgi:hypothetical protein